MAADRIDIKVTADTREATANLARFSDRAKDAAESAGRIGAGVLGAGAAMAAAAYKAAEFAAAVEQQDMAIRRLGPAYDAVRVATNGVVTAQDALKAQQTLVQAGIRVSTEQLATITRAAREYARATGTEMTQSLEQLTDALRTGSAEGLGRFGVALEQGQTGARAFSSALGQLQQQQQQTAVSSRTLREDLDKLPEGLMAIGRAAMSVLEGPADALTQWLTGLGGASMNLRQLLSELGGAADTLNQRELQAARDRANMERLAARETGLRNLQAIGLSDEGALRGLSPGRIEALTRRGFQITGSLIGPATPGNAARINIMRVGRGEASTQFERQALFQAAVEQARQEQAAEEALARLPQTQARTATAQRTSGGAARPARQGPRSVDELFASLFGERTVEDAFAQAEGRLRGLMANTLGAVSDPSVFDEILAESATEQGPRQQGFAERVFRAAGIELDEEGRTSAFDALQTGADLLGQSLGTLRSGFSELFNTLASGSMSAGEAFQQFAAKTLKSLGEMSINQGIALTFQGIAALFTNPVAAPLMLAGGAGLIALGTGLGAAGAAATPAPPSTGGAAPSAARSASGPSPRGDMGGGGNVTIVLSSLVPPGPRELQGLVHAQRQAGRYGLGDARMVPRQVRA